MAAFCEGKGLASEVVSIETLAGVVGRRCASATVEFRCILATAPNTAPRVSVRIRHEQGPVDSSGSRSVRSKIR